MRSIILLVVAGTAFAGDRDTILNEVKSIACPGSPGPLCVFSEAATPLVAAGNEVVIACAKLGKGRVFVCGHGGYFETDSLKNADTQKLIVNAIRWAGGEAKAITVLSRGFPALAKSLSGSGITSTEVNADWKSPAGAAVLIVSPGRINAEEAKKIETFVRNGGGLLTGTPGWGWRQTHSMKSLDSDMPLNQILAQAGITFADGTVKRPANGTFMIAPVSKYANAGYAIAALEAWIAGGEAPNSIDAEAMMTAIASLERSVPEAFAKPLQGRLAKSLTKAKGLPVPTAKKPLTQANGADRLLLSLSTRVMMQLPPESVTPHPAASEFPGKVDGNAPRISKSLNIRIGAKGYICNGVGCSPKSEIWHSTGLYAAPGEVVTITVPDDIIPLKPGIRIGAHSDQLWHLKSWQRAPEITRRFSIHTTSTKTANTFGGLIYLTVPPGLEPRTVSVTISNAVAAPLFELDRTTPEAWKESRLSKAPWAELVSKKIILTIPSEQARKIEDPAEILRFWDSVLEAEADLTCVSRERGRAERFVHDVQISAGYMHSGYPIMCPLNEAKRAVDLAHMQRDGAWGYFHELGHNHQQREWTFDGTVEVTCNLYSLYCTEKLCPKASMHGSMQPAAIRRHAVKYFEGGRKFDTWKDEPFTALIMYQQMKDAFGWDAYKKAIAKYHELKLTPRGDAAKRDEWLIQMSQATGCNLGPFFDSWGVPVSDAAKKKVAGLKKWDYPDAAK